MTDLVHLLAVARTLLFVPGNRPERFTKAAASGADLVVLDLEDAVRPTDKTEARHHVTGWLAQDQPCAVRINARGTPWHDDDVAAVSLHRCVVMVPKAEEPQALSQLARALPAGSCLIALVETARGVTQAVAIAGTVGVERLAFGSLDLASQLGVAPDDDVAMAWPRGALVMASAAAGITPPVDGVTGDVNDNDRLRRDVAYAVRLGFSGKLCIHPRQVGVVADALRPTRDEVAWARSVVEHAEEGGVVLLHGQMVDKPVLERAHRILSNANEDEPR